MSSENSFLKRFDLPSKLKSKIAVESPVINMMNDPSYLRQSSALINEALQKGFDVLQLPNGDIVTTGTKTVVHQYSWDLDKAKLVKTKADPKKLKDAIVLEESDFEEA